jgi:hypothetical protein
VRALVHRTAEVRWFFAGRVPREFRDWFDQGRMVAATPRTDEYLRFPSRFVGVKFREGNLEIKSLIEDCGASAWAGVRGRVQRWGKWSCTAPSVAVLRDDVVAQHRQVVAVTKTRRVRKFSFDHGLREVPADTRQLPVDGSNVELTELRVARADHWTFGVEAFAYGHPTQVMDFMNATAERLLGDPERPRRFRTNRSPTDALSIANSWSYPEWLLTV